MKKILCLALALILTNCGSNEEASDDPYRLPEVSNLDVVKNFAWCSYKGSGALGIQQFDRFTFDDDHAYKQTISFVNPNDLTISKVPGFKMEWMLDWSVPFPDYVVVKLNRDKLSDEWKNQSQGFRQFSKEKPIFETTITVNEAKTITVLGSPMTITESTTVHAFPCEAFSENLAAD